MNQENFQTILRIPQQRPMTIDEALTRGVNKIIPESTGIEQEMNEKKLRVYLGIDPTSPELHLGHTVPMRKLRHFQELGHEVVLLFGTFTAQIGDPTDKTAARVRLDQSQVEQNVTTYVDQVAKILDLSPNAPAPVAILYNHEWLAKLRLAEIIDLASNFTIQQMEDRSMYDERRKDGKPIWLHEYIYPIMQGWDAVAMKVDVEIGGKDQLFNMLTGRKLVNRYLNKEKWSMATKLLEDPNGKKMGKSEGNIVNISDWPEFKYETVMSWPDSTIPLGFELLTTVPMQDVEIISNMLTASNVNPMYLKESLAYRIVAELDGIEAADFALNEFDRVFRKKLDPSRLHEMQTELGTNVVTLLVAAGLVKNEDEAHTRLKSGSVFVDGKPISRNYVWDREEGVLQIGKRTLKGRRKVIRK
jgi:tyrosyl-tRNA synthetase